MSALEGNKLSVAVFITTIFSDLFVGLGLEDWLELDGSEARGRDRPGSSHGFLAALEQDIGDLSRSRYQDRALGTTGGCSMPLLDEAAKSPPVTDGPQAHEERAR